MGTVAMTTSDIMTHYCHHMQAVTVKAAMTNDLSM